MAFLPHQSGHHTNNKVPISCSCFPFAGELIAEIMISRLDIPFIATIVKVLQAYLYNPLIFFSRIRHSLLRFIPPWPSSPSLTEQVLLYLKDKRKKNIMKKDNCVVLFKIWKWKMNKQVLSRCFIVLLQI